jgi:hypothetical protein
VFILNDNELDLSEEEYEEEFEDFEEEDPKSLKEDAERIFGDQAQKFAEKKEKKDAENIIVRRAVHKRLKDRLSRRFEIWLPTDVVVEDGVKKKIIDAFEVRRPTDKEKISLEKFGVTNLREIRKLTGEEAKEADIAISEFLSRVVTDPTMSPEEWREDVDESIYQNLFFKVIATTMQTNDAELVNFFTTV